MSAMQFRRKAVQDLYEQHRMIKGLIFGDRHNETTVDTCMTCGLEVKHTRSIYQTVLEEDYQFRDKHGTDLSLREAIKRGCKQPQIPVSDSGQA